MTLGRYRGFTTDDMLAGGILGLGVILAAGYALYRLDRATHAAGGRNVRVGGGPSTIRQFLEARLIDDLHLATRPVLLGSGEPLLTGLNLRALGYTVERSVSGERATHVFLGRQR